MKTEATNTVALRDILIDGVGGCTTRHACMEGCVEHSNMRDICPAALSFTDSCQAVGIVHGSCGYVVLYGFKDRVCDDLRLIKFGAAVNHPVPNASNVVGFTFLEHTLDSFIVRLACAAVGHQSLMFTRGQESFLIVVNSVFKTRRAAVDHKNSHW